MLLHLILFLIGVSILYAGGELFIKGSSGIARIFGIKPLITGLVVAAFATSSPEFFVSVMAAVRKNEGLAIGNVVGSCICNIGMVLGLSALTKPVNVNISILRKELPILFGVTFGFFIMCLDFKITRPEAFILIISFILFIFYCIKNAKAEPKDLDFSKKPPQKMPRAAVFSYLSIGLLGLLYGAHLLVSSSIVLARYFGISELAVGLTAVAIGTSLPELATSLVAAFHGEGDISIGNVVGSNIFNILAIIGVVALIGPIRVSPSITIVSMPLLILYTLALALILKSGLKISRAEGAFLLVSYGVYLYFTLKI